MTDAQAALAEALHDCDETCHAHHYVAFDECATKEWDEAHAVEVLSALRVLGWTVVRDPAGTIPLEAPAMTDHLPSVCCREHAAVAVLPLIRENGDARVAAERERIANLFPRFIHGEMFDETPENDLDLDATAFAVGERFRFLIGAYPYREADHD